MSLDTAIRCCNENLALIQKTYGTPPRLQTPLDMKIAWNLSTALSAIAQSLRRLEDPPRTG